MDTTSSVAGSNTSAESLFITFDPYGIPERFSYHLEHSTYGLSHDDAFMKYMEEEIEYSRFFYPANNRFCRCDFSNAGISNDDLERFSKDRDELMSVITKNNLQPCYDFSMMAVDYLLNDIYRFRSPVFAKIRDAFRLDNPMTEDQVKIQRFLNNNTPAATLEKPSLINAVMVGDKILYFDRFQRGMMCRKMYLQYLADNFYADATPDTWRLVCYSGIPANKVNVARAAATRDMFSLYDRTFLPEKAQYLTTPIYLEDVAAESACIFHKDVNSFRKFAYDYYLDESAGNATINTLQRILYNGVTYMCFDDKFPYRKEFEEIASKYKGTIPDTAQYHVRNLEEKQLAYTLLKTRCGMNFPNPCLGFDNKVEADNNRFDIREKTSRKAHPKHSMR